MEFDAKYIGKIILSDNKDNLDFIIAGFDYIREAYLVVSLYNNSRSYYRFIGDIGKALDYDYIVNSINDKISEVEDVIEIVANRREYLESNNPEIDLSKIFRRIKECYINFNSNKSCAEHTSFGGEMYEKEVNNSKKGLRRALKRLYSVLDEDEYYVIVEYLEGHNYSLNDLNERLERYKKKKIKFKEGYKETIDYLKKAIY